MGIHLKQCEKKWEATEELKPSSERRPCPTAPQVEPGMSKQEYNEAATQKWDKEALLPCQNCGRTFLPDRLEVHLRSCRPKDGAQQQPMGPPQLAGSKQSRLLDPPGTVESASPGNAGYPDPKPP